MLHISYNDFMVDVVTKRKLPEYLEMAITSRTAISRPYSSLSQEQWRALAEHVYEDEIPRSSGGRGFLPRGQMNSWRDCGVKALLRVITYNAVENGHTEETVPHFQKAKELLERLPYRPMDIERSIGPFFDGFPEFLREAYREEFIEESFG